MGPTRPPRIGQYSDNADWDYNFAVRNATRSRSDFGPKIWILCEGY